MSEAMHIRESAQATKADYQKQIASLRQGREGLMEESRQAAEAERDALLAEANTQIARERQERVKQRAEEALRYSRELHDTGAHALVSLTRKALKDLADETLEQRIVSQAAARSAAMSEQLKQAAGEQTNAKITTQYPLPQDLQEKLITEFKQTLPELRAYVYRGPRTITRPELSTGWCTTRLDSRQLHERTGGVAT